MNGFDLAVLVIVLFCMIRGAYRGLIQEVSGIIAVIAGFYGAIMYYGYLTPHLMFISEASGMRSLAAFGILFAGIVCLIAVVAFLIRKLLQIVFLGWVDRLCGFVFGTAKGVLIVSVLFLLISPFASSGPQSLMGRSLAAPYVAISSRVLTVFVSQNVKLDFSKHLEGVRTRWN